MEHSNIDDTGQGTSYTVCEGRQPNIPLTVTRNDSQHLVQRHLSANGDRTRQLTKSFVSKLKMSRAQKDLVIL